MLKWPTLSWNKGLMFAMTEQDTASVRVSPAVTALSKPTLSYLLHDCISIYITAELVLDKVHISNLRINQRTNRPASRHRTSDRFWNSSDFLKNLDYYLQTYISRLRK